jgi:hypothetical protein
VKFVGRLIWVFCAALLAGVVALGAAVLLGFGLMNQEIAAATAAGTDPAAVDRWFDLADRTLLAGTLVFALSLIPAALVLIIGEVGKVRSLLFYLVGGAVSVAGAPALAALSRTAADGRADTPLLLVLTTSGFVAGFAYWLLAGRTA